MSQLTVCFLGLGLIGGSIAKSLHSKLSSECTIKAYDPDISSLKLATKEGIISHSYSNISDVILYDCDYIFLCAPVSCNDENINRLKDRIPKECLITDVGSVKNTIHSTIKKYGLEHQFIGGHPMAGSNKVGFCYSSERLIENAYYILTPTKEVNPEKVKQYEQLIEQIGAIPLVLEEEQHDYATAAISHLPHIISASLVNLVKESDTPDGIMKLIAAGGFKDITRIASSCPTMWQQITLTNQKHISNLLHSYIKLLQKIEQDLLQLNSKQLYSLFDEARNYRDSFTDFSFGPIKKAYLCYVDIPDESGVIATIATLLAKHNINLKNIGIIHNREFEEGVLCIEFYEQHFMEQAAQILQQFGYTVFSR